MFSHTVVEDYINKTKTTLDFNFELYQDFQLQHGHTHTHIHGNRKNLYIKKVSL